jgi:hypothetical protein
MKLVIDGHLSVPERNALGTVSRLEVKEIVKSLLLAQGVFPDRAEAGAVYEGATLKRAPSEIQIIWRRAHPLDPFTVAASRTETFRDVDAAVERFVHSEWEMGIDGIRLE